MSCIPRLYCFREMARCVATVDWLEVNFAEATI